MQEDGPVPENLLTADGGSIIVASINVNGIRAAVRRGMRPWLDARAPDVICLQEVRAPDDAVYEALGDGWHGVHAEAEAKGRAGVAVFSRVPPIAVRVGLGIPEFATAGRWVEADLPLTAAAASASAANETASASPGSGGPGVLTVVSVYVHTGEADTPRQDEKHRFLDAARDRMLALAADGRHVLVCGDLNVAHREADLKNWKGNLKKSGFLPAERAWFDRLFGEDSWLDVVRSLAGEGPGPYSWWSWRGKAFDVDSGWRIDYQLASPELGTRAVKAEIDRAPTYAERWSDHAPVVVTYEF
jgi:exodeoxyribonuclease III